MKKTAQSLLTAAMFAAALGNSAANASTGSTTAFAAERSAAVTTAPFTTTEEVTTMTSAPLYGPPWVFSDLSEEPAETTAPEDDPTYTEPSVLYGPPSVFYPRGDVTMDNKTDARDLTMIKRIALAENQENIGYAEFDIADVNHDRVVDREDVQIFREEVLGFPKEEEAVTTTTTVTNGPEEDPDIVSSLETTTETTVALLYGPPPMRE